MGIDGVAGASGYNPYESINQGTVNNQNKTHNANIPPADTQKDGATHEDTHSTMLPSLTKPTPGAINTAGLVGIPSMGAGLSALMVDMASDQRRQSADQRVLQEAMVVEKIEEQAKEMKTKAIVQMALGVVTGVASIAGGAISTGLSAKAIKADMPTNVKSDKLNKLEINEVNLKKQNINLKNENVQLEQQNAALGKQNAALNNKSPSDQKIIDNNKAIENNNKAIGENKTAIDNNVTATKTNKDKIKLEKQVTATQLKQKEHEYQDGGDITIDTLKEKQQDVKPQPAQQEQNIVQEQPKKELTLEEKTRQSEMQAARTAESSLRTVRNQAINQTVSSMVEMFSSITESVGGIYDSDIKMMDAEIEVLRGTAEVLKSLEDSLKELIQKSLSTQDAIQQNMNSTRSKILG